MVVPLVLLLCAVYSSSAITVDLPLLGLLEGTNITTHFRNRPIYKFTGIPYAEPPIEDNRFKPPIAKTPWTGTLYVTEPARSCPQANVFSSLRAVFIDESLINTRDTEHEEDCLTLDIYTPTTDSISLPVLFYIHGGSFIMGASNSITADFVLEHDIVLVAPQYRLGPLGFLALNTTDKTANAGLYDVLMALEFVYKYIDYFGGDPHRITVGGSSAGAALTGLLYVSPLAQDLVSQAMLSSGSGIAPWVVDTDPFTHSRAIARLAGCNNDTDDEILECLQTGPSASALMMAYLAHSTQERIGGHHGMGGTIPVVDGDILTELPLVTLQRETFKGRPLVISTTKHEGIFLTDIMVEYFLKPNQLMNASDVLRHDIADILMGFTDIEDPAHVVGASLLETYFYHEDLGDLDAMTPGIVDFNGAAYFKGPALKTAELNSIRGGTSYLTAFNYDPDGTGVNHSGDQKYLFPRNPASYTESDLAMAETLTELYMRFVINGSPSQEVDAVDWSSYSREEKNYLNIHNSLEMKQGFEQEFAITEIARRRSTGAAQLYLSQPLVVLGAVMLNQRIL